MRKSPGKWIKTLLLGKKSFKSRSSRGKTLAESAEGPVISEPISITTNPVKAKPYLENEVQSEVASCRMESFPDRKDRGQVASATKYSNCNEKSREEEAATKVQSAFRGYLARRAFRALKGIIRLQAVIRGHLVRRQAVATLKCMWGIVKIQCLVRNKKFSHVSEMQDVNHMKSFRSIRSSILQESSANAFIRKILSFSVSAKLLKIQFDRRDSNEALIWIERWTFSRFWKFVPTQEKSICPNLTESLRSRPKLSVRRNFGNKKSPALTTQENSESELEKVKRSLRKVSSASGQHPTSKRETLPDNTVRDAKTECFIESTDQERVDNKPAEDNGAMISQEKVSADQCRKVNAEVEDHYESVMNGNNGDLLSDDKPSVDIREVRTVKPKAEEEEKEEKEEGTIYNNGSLTTEQKTSIENQRGSKRRASFPAKPEQVEKGVQNSPAVPSYMAATQSAKAKFNGHASDGAEKAALVRRHSLPSGKIVSVSPRTQRAVQSSCKAGIKEKPASVAWKR